jgi:hypothetical protein
MDITTVGQKKKRVYMLAINEIPNPTYSHTSFYTQGIERHTFVSLRLLIDPPKAQHELFLTVRCRNMCLMGGGPQKMDNVLSSKSA